ncbi:MAG: hypothetical protein ACJ73V_09805 [Acidimicrobiia bacterium]
MRRTSALAAVALVLLPALAACGGSSSAVGSGPPRPPAEPDEVVVRVVTSGGFTGESRQAAHLPKVSVFADGRVVVLGPTTLEFPGPALPNLQEFRVTDDGLDRILRAARDAGLLADESPDYGEPGVTDQATTTVTVRADGRTRQVDVYALGFTGRVSGVTPEQSQRRRGLERLIELAGDAGALGHDVVAASERRYDPTAVAALVRRSDATDVGGETHAWPLGDLAGTDCVVLTGDDVPTVTDSARTAREGDAWTSAGATYNVVFRPLLPDEHTCAEVAR